MVATTATIDDDGTHNNCTKWFRWRQNVAMSSILFSASFSCSLFSLSRFFFLLFLGDVRCRIVSLILFATIVWLDCRRNVRYTNNAMASTPHSLARPFIPFYLFLFWHYANDVSVPQHIRMFGWCRRRWRQQQQKITLEWIAHSTCAVPFDAQIPFQRNGIVIRSQVNLLMLENSFCRCSMFTYFSVLFCSLLFFENVVCQPPNRFVYRLQF